MRNILFLKEDVNSEISLIREQTHDTKRIQITPGLSLGWSDFTNVNMVTFLNPCTDVELRIIKLAKTLISTTIRIDWSIDPFSIPQDHTYYKYMDNPSANQIVKECLGLADVFTASNLEIWNRLKIFTKTNCQISVYDNSIHNTFYQMFKSLTFAKQSENKTVLWRGRESYLKNLVSYSPQISRVGEARKDWDFVFIGDIDAKYMKLPNHIPSKPIIPYLSTIKEIAPSIMILPMEFDEYSRTRNADLFWEAKLCGAVCLAPDLPSWQNLPAVLYNSKEGFETSLALLMDNSELRTKIYEEMEKR